MPIDVSDVRSSPSDQIAHAAKVIGKSSHRRAVFRSIYYGKKKIKTVEEIHEATSLSRKRVLEEAKKLVKNHVIHQTRKDGDTAYQKDSFYDQNKRKILSLAGKPKKLAQFPTKVTPQPIVTPTVTIRIPRQRVRARLITIDDIDSFSRVRRKRAETGTQVPILEAKFKSGVKRILNERGIFRDWGGERNDLLTTRLRFRGKRRAAAFAFKGRGRRGILTPAAMGKHGDQIQRLFTSPAEVFIVQYWDQIAESVLEQMSEFAKAKSVAEGKEIFYGVIDGQDTARLLDAYPKQFGMKRKSKKD
jgi:hypothetical protein